MDSMFSIIGSIASIGSAFWAYLEARKAKSSMKEAQKYRNEILNRINTSALERIHEDTKRILHKVSYFGPSSNTTSIRGKNSQEIASETDEYVRSLREQVIHFKDSKIRTIIESACTELCPCIKGLAESKSFEDKKANGSQMHSIISNLLPITKNAYMVLTLKEI